MGSGHFVTAAVVAVLLGSAWPVGAQEPVDKEKKPPQNSRPTNPAGRQQDKAPAETSKGRNGGTAAPAQGRIPGTGGEGKAQSTLGSPPPSTTPTGNTLYNPNKPKPTDGKVVGPDYFKSNEQRVNEMANPTPAPPGDDAKRKLLEHSGSDSLGELKTTITPGEGKTGSTTRQQQSEDGADAPRLRVTTKTEGSTGVVTLSGNRGEVATRFSNDGNMLSETIKVRDKDATTVLVKDYTTKTTTITVTFHNGLAFRQVNDGEMKRIKTPNPETDTGDGHMPRGAAKDPPKKSPSEIEAERRRQAGQPTDDQRRVIERVKMEAETALKSAAAKRTDGRIDANPVGDGPVGSAGSPKLGSGSGCVQVDCQTGGPGSGTGNPTASGGTGQATGSEPPKP